MGFDFGRLALGISTGGLSEAARGLNGGRLPGQSDFHANGDPQFDPEAFHNPSLTNGTTQVVNAGLTAAPRNAPQATPAAQISQQAMAPGLGITNAGLAAAQSARAQQQANVGTLQAAAAGTAPSAAAQQQAIGLAQGMRQNLALAASNRGSASSGILAQQAALDANARLGASTIASGTALRANEQAVARGQLTDALSGVRQQDIGGAQIGVPLAGIGADVAKTQAQLDQSTNIANLDAQLKQTGMDDQQRLAFLGARLGIDARTQQGQMALAGLLQDSYMKAQGINAGVDAGNAQNSANLFTGVLGAGASLGAGGAA
jgi:hypothetical protein